MIRVSRDPQCEDVPVTGQRHSDESEYRGLLGLLGAMRDLRGLLRARRRPTISLSAARSRYDGLVDLLADRLGSDLGLEWRVGGEAQITGPRRRRTFRTHTYVADVALSDLCDWQHKLQRALAEIADPPTPFVTIDAATAFPFGMLKMCAPLLRPITTIPLSRICMSAEHFGWCATATAGTSKLKPAQPDAAIRHRHDH